MLMPRGMRPPDERRALPPNARVVVAAQVPAKGAAGDELLAACCAFVVAAGATVLGTMLQRRHVSRADRPGGSHMLERPLAAATYIGPGKVRDLAALVQDLRADAVVFANPLRGGQRARLEAALGVPVVIWYGAELR